jgi:hypothetical protein
MTDQALIDTKHVDEEPPASYERNFAPGPMLWVFLGASIF